MGAARRGRDHIRCLSRFIVLTILALLLPSSIGILSQGVPSSSPSKADVPAEAVQAFSGIHKASDFASTIIYGEDLPVRGRLGHYSWTGDVNGDGLNDLIVAAPGAPGVGGFEDEGRIYVFYGNSEGLPQVLDLDKVEPDILIISNNTWFVKRAVGANPLPYPVLAYLTNEFDTGDYDGDGYRDMAFSIPATDTPTWGVIIYGREGGYPGKLVVHLQKAKVFSVTPGDMRYLWIYNRSLAPGQDNIVLPSYMESSDLDGDGADELISGGRYGVNILWGRSTEWTTINGTTPNDHFGYALDIGDMDGDGLDDLLIGAPLSDDPMTGRTDCGAAYLIFNASRIKGSSTLLIDEIARPVVFGGSDQDHLGRTVMLTEVDGDGSKDMMIAAPEADGGPGVQDCGRLYTYRGGEENTFPTRMVADETAHWTVIGNSGKVSGTTEYPGDRLGAVLDAGDVDGDGSSEIVLGFYSRTSVLSEPSVVDSVGMIMVFEASDLFPTGGAIQRLERTGGSLVIEGDEMRDTLGWQVFVGDVTNDGVDDILVGAPGADGPDNDRISDGEAYIIQGCSTFIGDIMGSGGGYSAPYLLAGGMEVLIEVGFSLSGAGRSATECSLHLTSGALSSTLLVGPGGLISVEGPSGLDPIAGSCGLQQKDGTGQARFAFSMDWNCMREGPIDLVMVLKDGSGVMFYREYPMVLSITKDVILANELEVTRGTSPLSGIGEWVLPGDELHMTGLKGVYSKATKVEIPAGSLDLVLKVGSDTIGRKGYTTDWSHTIVVPQKQGWDLSIGLEYPMGAGSKPVDMDISGSRTFRINIDTAPPFPPEGVRAVSRTTGLPEFDRTGLFDLFWNGSVGPELDPAGSGVREFQVQAEGKWLPAIAGGGLIGTYYRGRSYQEAAFQRKDASLNFSLKDWGPFGPDPSLLRYDDFSVRWHGYLVPTINGSYLVSIRGSGSVIIKLDGRVFLGRTSILEDVQLTLPDMRKGSIHSMEVYFSNELVSSYLSLDIWDPTYKRLSHDEMPFSYPSNSTSAVLGQDEGLGIAVRSIDWTGRISSTSTARAFKDTRPPVIVPEWGNAWFNSTRPLLHARVVDTGGENVSGIDIASIAYSFEREGTTKPVWQNEDMGHIIIEQSRSAPLDVAISLSPYLDGSWRGTLRFTAVDMSGNRAISDPIWMGMDTEPPEISLLSPVEGAVLYGGVQDLTVSFYDGIGSGPDIGSLQLRSTSEDGSWSEWMLFEVNATSRLDVLTGKASLRLGRSEVQFRGWDLAGNPTVSRTYVLDIMEPPVNLPPIPRIAHPTNGTHFYKGQLIELSATGTWDDGLGPNETLALTWFSSKDGHLGSGPLIKAQLSLGVHNITLFADDGALGHNKSTKVTIEMIDHDGTASDDDRPPGSDVVDPLSIFAVLALLGVVLVLLVFVIIERKRAPEGSGTKDIYTEGQKVDGLDEGLTEGPDTREE
ncbi:MAG: PA14 domain-containing protein [Candidatus Thermoplasmatota archaeon]|jgi:hypothetical protein|nr:PA14 domain-containing protein [Candidatus Thermoplasmatota archaeon]